MTASRLKNLAVAITLGLQSLSKLPRLPRLSSRLMLRMKILKTMVEVNQSLAQRIMSLTSVFWIIMRYIVFSFCSVVRIADIYVLLDIFSLQLRSQQRQSHSLQQGKPKHENRSARPQMSEVIYYVWLIYHATMCFVVVELPAVFKYVRVVKLYPYTAVHGRLWTVPVPSSS